MKTAKLKIYLFLYFFFFVFVNKSLVNAFSLGPIKVKSKFGEKLDAEIIVLNDNIKGLKAGIGTKEEYEMLGLSHNDILNDVSIKVLPWEKSSGKQIIRIYSKKFLFYPSIELVIKASLANGTIIEKYILAADFRHNLSVSLFSDSNTTSGTSNVLTLPANLSNKNNILSASKPVNPKKKRVDLLSNLKDTNIQKQLQNEEKKDKKYGPVLKGDNLYRIAKKLGIKGYTVHQVAVALWKMNKTKFINNNMNTIKQNVYIDYNKLSFSLSTITNSAAKLVVNEQKFDWKQLGFFSKKQLKQLKKMSVELSKKDPLYEQIYKWKKLWEDNNVDNLMSLYSRKFKTGNKGWGEWKEFKKYFISRFHNIKIKINNLELYKLKNKNIVFAVFLQNFLSDEMKSTGQKILKLAKEKDRWLIIDERWKNIRDIPSFSKAKDGLEDNSLVYDPTVKGKSLLDNEFIFELLFKWEKFWDKSDIEGLLSLYSEEYKNSIYGQELLRGYRNKLSTNSNDSDVSIKNIEGIQAGDSGFAYVAYNEDILSGGITLTGQKTLTLKKIKGKWLINEEYKQSSKNTNSKPYVIHVSSLNSYDKALSETNKWRRRGFLAYSVFTTVAGKGNWYRIFLNRFSYKTIAEKFVKYIKSSGYTKYALIMKMPYAVEFGTTSSKEDALHLAMKFRGKNKISPFISVHHNKKENNTLYKVLMGAYVSADQASIISAKLEANKIKHKVVRQ